MNGIVNISGVQQQTYSQSTTRGQIREDGQVALHGADEVTVSSAKPFQQKVVVLDGDPVKVGRELGNVPAAHSEAGGVAQYLSGVSDERFFDLGGQPNYNGLLADLGRKSWATFPDSLEDGRLPNLSTFQRAVASERAKREQTLPTVMFMIQPELRLQSAIGVAVERALETDVRSYSGVASSQSPVQGQLALDPQTGAFAQVEERESSVTPYTVTAQIVDNPERELAGMAPSITELTGGVAAFLRSVPSEHFYNEAGNPNYNKIFANLARFNGVTGPEALEDGTMPNISTFQRSVAKERARREQESAGQMASFLVGNGFAGPQGQRVLDLAAKMAGIG